MLVLRGKVEEDNRAVAVCLDGTEVVTLARSRVFDGSETTDRLAATLQQLKEAGATAIAPAEYTGADLINAGYAIVAPQTLVTGSGESALAVQFQGPDTAFWARRVWLDVLNRQGIQYRGSLPQDRAFLFGMPVSWFEAQPFAVALSELKAARAAGMQVFARIGNPADPQINLALFHRALGESSGAVGVIFLRDQVAGYPDHIREAADALRAAGLPVCTVEFANQLGENALARALDGAVLRVHSIAANELPTLALPTINDRFVRAVTERGIRVCYLHLPVSAQTDLAAATAYVRAIRNALDRARGVTVGAPQPPGPLHPPLWAIAVILIGSVAAGKYALRLLAPVPPGWLLALWLIEAGGLALLLFVKPWQARQLAALLAAIVFPMLAMLWVVTRLPWRQAANAALGRLLARSAGGALLAAGTAIVGGMLVAGMMSDRLTMTRVVLFAGVRISQAAPFVLMAVVLAVNGWAQEDSWRPYWLRVTAALRSIGERPLLLWQAAAAVVLLGAVAFWLARAGHETGVGVSGTELKLRALLEDVFWARPRLKEVFVGHPALVIGIALAHGRCKGLAKLFLLAGAIAPASIVNTFCHLHSPLVVTFTRTIHGIWIGVLLGLMAVVVLHALDGGRWLWSLTPPPAGRDADGTEGAGQAPRGAAAGR